MPDALVDAAHPPGWVFYGGRFHFIVRGYTLCRKFTYVKGKVFRDDGRRAPGECVECSRAAKSQKLITRKE